MTKLRAVSTARLKVQQQINLHEDNPRHTGTSEICGNDVRPEDAAEELKEAPLQIENGYKEKDRNEYVESMFEARLR